MFFHLFRIFRVVSNSRQPAELTGYLGRLCQLLLIIFISITWYITLIHHNISHNIKYINYTGLRSIKLLVSGKKKRKEKKKHTKIYYNKNWRRLVNKDDIYCIYSGHRASHNLHHVCNFIRHSFLYTYLDLLEA